MIIRMGIQWSYKAGNELIDEGLDPSQLKEIETLIRDCPQVVSIHHLKSRKMAGDVLLDVHIQVPPYLSVSEGHLIVDTVRYKLMTTFPHISDVTTHVDVIHDDEALPNALPPTRELLLQRYQGQWQQILGKSNAIEHVTLHYLTQGIELELLICTGQWPTPAELKRFHHSFQEEAAAIDDLASIKLTWNLQTYEK